VFSSYWGQPLVSTGDCVNTLATLCRKTGAVPIQMV
jgi:hypothetical protein